MQSHLLTLFLLTLISIQIQAEGNEPQFRQPVNCAKQKDGNYVWGCSRYYSICTNGRELPMQCYMGLKLNPDNNQCDSPSAIDVCQDPNSASQLYRSKDPFNCAELIDGLYEANPCSPGYIQCTQGRRFDQTCPNGLVFNSNAGVCDYASKCKKAKSKKRVMKKIAYTSQQAIMQDTFSNPNLPSAPQSPQPYNNQPAQSNPSVQDDPPQALSFDCVGKSNGVYVQNEAGCNNGFWKCANGQAFTYNCSAGLVYNAQNGQCDYPQYVAACGGTPIDPPTTTTASPSINAPQFDCTARADGFYSRGHCDNSYFYSCLGGTSSALQCSQGLVFDTLNNICDYREECGKQKTTMHSQQEDPVKSNLEHGTSGYYFNSGRKHLFKVAYSQSYSNPNAGNQQQQVEPIPQQQFQIPPNSQQMIPIAITGEVSQQPSQPSSSSPQSSSPTATSNSIFDCGGKRNGYYVQRQCTRNFFSCSNGISTQGICPTGLVFDMEKAQCEFPSNCGQSNNPQNPSPPQSQQPSSVIEVNIVPPTKTSNGGFDCTGKPNGNYFKQRCQPNWIICADGQTINQTCPNGLVFNSDGAQCDFPANCEKSGNVNDIPNPPLQSPPPSSSNVVDSPQSPSQSQCGQSPQIPVNQQLIQPQPAQSIVPSAPQTSQLTSSRNPPSFNCEGKPDGTYLRTQCQSNYIVCSGGFARPQKCPNGLLFDAETAQCEFPSECVKNRQLGNIGQSSSMQPITQQSYQQTQQPIQQQLSPPVNPPSLPNSAQGFQCTRRIDGYYYKTACTPHFYTCVGGHATQLTCPGNLVFDPTNAYCQYPEVCGRTSQSSQNGGQNSNPQPPPPQADFDCQGKRNGYYVKKGCTPDFYSCLGGIATKLICPGNLVFDSQSASCQYPTICANQQQQLPNVAPSNIVPSNPSPPPSPPQSQQSPRQQPQQIPTSNNVMTPSAPIFDCTGRENGAYAIVECQNQYIQCSNGFAHEQQCPEPLVFSTAANNSCDYITSCRSPSSSNSVPPESTLNKQEMISNHIINVPNTQPTNQQQIPLLSNQQAPVNQQQPNAAQVIQPSNSANQQPPQPQSSIQTPSQLPPSQPSIQGQQLPLRPQNKPSPVIQPTNASFCAIGNKSDGMYAQGCNNHFYVCSGGITTLMNCPVGVYFDEEMQKCDMRESIVACGGQKNQTEQSPQDVGQPNTQQPSNSSSNNTSPPATIPPSEFDCSKKAIGYYSKGCNTRYYSCTGISTYAFDCPSELKYDQEAGQCEYFANVPECGGSRPTTPTPVAPLSSQQSSGQTQPGEQPQPFYGQHPLQPMNNPCTQLSDGSYSPPGCNGYYFTCQGGKATEYYCPEGHVYVASSQSCIPSQQVPSCL